MPYKSNWESYLITGNPISESCIPLIDHLRATRLLTDEHFLALNPGVENILRATLRHLIYEKPKNPKQFLAAGITKSIVNKKP